MGNKYTAVNGERLKVDYILRISLIRVCKYVYHIVHISVDIHCVASSCVCAHVVWYHVPVVR